MNRRPLRPEANTLRRVPGQRPAGLQLGVWLRPRKSGIGTARCYSVGYSSAWRARYRITRRYCTRSAATNERDASRAWRRSANGRRGRNSCTPRFRDRRRRISVACAASSRGVPKGRRRGWPRMRTSGPFLDLKEELQAGYPLSDGSRAIPKMHKRYAIF